MFLTLPDSGVKVRVWVTFDSIVKRQGTYRLTTVSVSDEQGNPMTSGTSWCSPKDNFCRLTGRKLACEEMFKRERKLANDPLTRYTTNHLSKRDRAAIFNAVCPTYRKRKEMK